MIQTKNMSKKSFNLFPKRFNVSVPVKRKTKLGFFDIPSPKGLPVVGTKLSLMASGGGLRLHEYVDKRHKTLGPIFREHLSHAQIVFISSPNLIRHLFQQEGKYPSHILPDTWLLYNKMHGCKRGLLFMEGEEWYQNRKILNKYFLKDGADNWFTKPIDTVTNELIARWLRGYKANFQPNLEADFYRLSIEILVAILVDSSDMLRKSKYYDELLDRFSDSVRRIFVSSSKMYVMPASFYATLKLKTWQDFEDAMQTSILLAKKLIEEIIEFNNKDEGLIGNLLNEGICKDDLIKIIIDFIMAASDTTSYTLLWTLYLLAQNPKYCESIRENEHFITYVIKESMRLYPVSPFLSRIIANPIQMGDFIIPERVPIVASIYTSARDKNYFTEPEKFLPERWDRVNKEKMLHTASASLPFAMGSRSCIGRRIATLQLHATISKIINTFDINLIDNSKVDAITSMVLIPKQQIKIQFNLISK